MLKNCGSKLAKTDVLDLEGFNLKSIGFIIKELTLCSSYYNTIFFKPSVSFTELLAYDQQTVLWLTHNLHGLDWEDGDTPYSDLKTICSSLSFRFTRKFFCTEKCELLSKLLEKTVYNLEDFNCHRISKKYFQRKQLLHTVYIPIILQQTVKYSIIVQNVKTEYFHSGHKVMHRKETATLTTYLSDNLKIFTCVTPLDDQPIVLFNRVQDPCAPIQNNYIVDQQKRANFFNIRPGVAQQPRYNPLYSTASKRYFSTITLSAEELDSFRAFLPLIDNFYHFQLYVKN